MNTRVIAMFAIASFLIAIVMLMFPARGKQLATYTCAPLASVMGDDKDFAVATQDQLRFLEAIYIMQKWAPDDLPPGDKAYLKRIGDNTKVVFADGSLACASMMVYKAGTAALDQIEHGEINHVGTPL